MKTAIIDIGSNSVRLAIFADGKLIYIEKITAQLGEGIVKTKVLSQNAIQRNLDAICKFVLKAQDMGVGNSQIYPFATAAVRQSTNGQDFVALVYQKTGLKIHVLSEDLECQVAVIGALSNKNGTVLDVGGASSELVKFDGKIVYSKSLDTGAVKLTDQFLEDSKIFDYLSQKVKEYNAPQIENLTAIGGTATCLAYILSGDKVYDRDKNHGRFVPITDLYAHLLKIKSLSVDERAHYFNIEKSRAKTIYSGGVLIYTILKYLNLNGFTVSEKDNLEGYYALKFGGKNEK